MKRDTSSVDPPHRRQRALPDLAALAGNVPGPNVGLPSASCISQNSHLSNFPVSPPPPIHQNFGSAARCERTAIFEKKMEAVASKLADLRFRRQVIGGKRQKQRRNDRGLESALWQLQIKARHGSRYVRSVSPQIPLLIHLFHTLSSVSTKCSHSTDNPPFPSHPS